MNDFTATITVDVSPETAFAAINDVRGWWSLDVEGSTDTLGAEFIFRGEDVHYSKIKIVELVPDVRVAWLVLDNHMSFIDDQTEWKNTRIIFDISPTSDGTRIRFSHVGLVPEYECFDVCSNAWSFFITDSLRSLITTGTGEPMPKYDGIPASRPA